MPKPKTSKAAAARTRAVRTAAPQFASEAEEQAFWAEQDTVPYVDWSTARPMWFPDRTVDSHDLAPAAGRHA